MQKQEIRTYQERELSKMERINQKQPLYLCVDCESLPCLCTPNKKDAERYAAEHYCTISFYPIGTYTEIVIN
jgi:hypothetical protein